jgi:dolichol kinase
VTGPALRRILHAGTALLLLIVPLFSWDHLRWMLTVGVVCAAGVEALRLSRPSVRTWLDRYIPVFRSREARRPSGAAWLAAGYAIAAWVPAPAPAAGILVAALADPAASWMGTRAGPAAGKTWVGTGAAWAVGVSALVALGYPWVVATVAAAAGAGLERWNGALDDNLTVAPGVAAAVFLLA